MQTIDKIAVGVSTYLVAVGLFLISLSIAEVQFMGLLIIGAGGVGIVAGIHNSRP